MDTRLLRSCTYLFFIQRVWFFLLPISLVTIPHWGIKHIALVIMVSGLGESLILPFLTGTLSYKTMVTKRATLFFLILMSLLSFISIFIILKLTPIRIEIIASIASLSGLLASLSRSYGEALLLGEETPILVENSKLPKWNALIKRVDLSFDILTPLCIGGLLSLCQTLWKKPDLGISICWLFCLFATFALGYNLRKHPTPSTDVYASSTKKPDTLLLKKTISALFFHPLSLLIWGYSFLWVTVLSHGGGMLTTYLKLEGVSEFQLGVFRSLGGIMGVVSTILFPILSQKKNINHSATLFLFWQCVFISLAVICFSQQHTFLFMLCILLSRPGLYGFCQAQWVLRQTQIMEKDRASVNGVSGSLNGLTSSGTALIGFLLPASIAFSSLVFISGGAVLASLAFFVTWSKKANA